MLIFVFCLLLLLYFIVNKNKNERQVKNTFEKHIPMEVLKCDDDYKCQNFRQPPRIARRGGDKSVAESATPENAHALVKVLASGLHLPMLN